VRELERALVNQARDAGDALCASYTHLQPAQPIRLAHWWLAHAEAFTRDEERFAEAREAADRLDYGQALTDLDQLLSSSPRNADALTLKKQVLYSQGKRQLDQRKYRDSYATLNQLAKIAPNYEDSATLMRQSRTRLIDEYYNSGIRYYREEKLPEAIAQWKAVLEIDPQHVNARKYLDQAERLLKQLDERRK
jgi:tetratricopeptide (TPR) repeat protein